VLAVGAAGFIYTVAARWLGSRKGDGLIARGARALAGLMMLGFTRQPVYVAPDQRLRVIGADGVPRPPR
jgi:hypothetical protein